MKRLLLILGLLFIVIGCATAPTPTPSVPLTPTDEPTPIPLPTLTPYPLTDPALHDLKVLLKKGVDDQNSDELQHTVSFIKWVGAIYRVGGTEPIDPVRGLQLTMNFIKEAPVTMDIDRPTYEPVWNVPAGDTAMLALITPKDGSDPFYAHFYIQREPSAWRFTGIMTRIPYYDAPSVAQLRATPDKYAGKEFMYVGAYQPQDKPPANAGTKPDNPAFVLDTFSGPLWVTLSTQKYVVPLPTDADAHAGENVRLFGTIKVNNGAPYLEIDSFQYVKPDSWAHTQGVIGNVDSSTRRVTLKPTGNGASVLQLTETSFISLPDGARAKLDALKAGQTVDATGVPQADGSLLVEELFVSK
jgi:hypothetical protein